LIPPLAWLLTAPLAAGGATGMLARRNAMTAVRRTAATAAPVLVTVGIAGSLIVGTDTLIATQQSAARTRSSAPGMIIPRGGAAGGGAPARRPGPARPGRGRGGAGGRPVRGGRGGAGRHGGGARHGHAGLRALGR